MEAEDLDWLYRQVECNLCGAARRVTFLCPDCHELLCENCCLIGTCFSLEKVINKQKRTAFYSRLTSSTADLTLSNLNQYILQDLLPVLECQYDRLDFDEMIEAEPHSKKNPSAQDYPIFHAIQETLRKKEADKSRCKERFSATKDLVFQKKASPQTIFDLMLNNVHVSIDVVPKDAAVSIVLKWRLEQPGLKKSSSMNKYDHLSFDYSNPLLLALGAGVINSDAKYVDNASKNLSLNLQQANKQTELHSFTYDAMENKSFMSFLSRPKPSLALFIKLAVKFFVLDSSLLEAHDEVINTKILEIELDHKETFKEIKDTSKKLLPLITEARMKKEEYAQVTKQHSKRLEGDGKAASARIELRSLMHPRFTVVILICGVLLAVLDWVNPAAVNNLFIN